MANYKKSDSTTLIYGNKYDRNGNKAVGAYVLLVDISNNTIVHARTNVDKYGYYEIEISNAILTTSRYLIKFIGSGLLQETEPDGDWEILDFLSNLPIEPADVNGLLKETQTAIDTNTREIQYAVAVNSTKITFTNIGIGVVTISLNPYNASYLLSGISQHTSPNLEPSTFYPLNPLTAKVDNVAYTFGNDIVIEAGQTVLLKLTGAIISNAYKVWLVGSELNNADLKIKIVTQIAADEIDAGRIRVEEGITIQNETGKGVVLNNDGMKLLNDSAVSVAEFLNTSVATNVGEFGSVDALTRIGKDGSDWGFVVDDAGQVYSGAWAMKKDRLVSSDERVLLSPYSTDLGNGGYGAGLGIKNSVGEFVTYVTGNESWRYGGPSLIPSSSEVIVDGNFELSTVGLAPSAPWFSTNTEVQSIGIGDSKCAVLDGNGTLYQDITTVSGKVYNISFYRNFGADTATSIRFQIFYNDLVTPVFTKDLTIKDEEWVYFSTQYFAPGISTLRVKITNLGSVTPQSAAVDGFSIKYYQSYSELNAYGLVIANSPDSFIRFGQGLAEIKVKTLEVNDLAVYGTLTVFGDIVESGIITVSAPIQVLNVGATVPNYAGIEIDNNIDVDNRLIVFDTVNSPVDRWKFAIRVGGGYGIQTGLSSFESILTDVSVDTVLNKTLSSPLLIAGQTMNLVSPGSYNLFTNAGPNVITIGSNTSTVSVSYLGIGTNDTGGYQLKMFGADAGLWVQRSGGAEPFIFLYDGTYGGQVRSYTDKHGLRFTNAASTTTFMSITQTISTVYSPLDVVSIGGFLIGDDGTSQTRIQYTTANAYFEFLGVTYMPARASIFDAMTSFSVNSVTVIDSSRNLSNIGTISSSSITTTGTLAVNAAGGITTNQVTFPLINTTATTVNAFGAATKINFSVLTFRGGLFDDPIGPNLFIDAPTLVGSGNYISLFPTITDGDLYSSAVFFTMGAPSGTVVLNNPTVRGSQTTATLWNTIATTVNFAGAATGLNIGAATGTATFRNATNNFSNSSAFQIGGITIIDGSRNLTNIGTISSSSVTTSGQIKASYSSGVIVAGNGVGAPYIGIDGAAANVRDLRYYTNGSLRWVLRSNSTAESGSNIGSDFEILSRDDSGGALATVMAIARSTGTITTSGIIVANGITGAHSFAIGGSGFEIYRDGGAALVGIRSYSDVSSAMSYIGLYGYGGTKASPTDVADQRQLGVVQYSAYINAGVRAVAQMYALADGTISPTSYPASLYWKLVPNGSTALTTRMILGEDGSLTIGATKGTGAARINVNEVRIGTTTVIDSSRNISNITNFSNSGTYRGGTGAATTVTDGAGTTFTPNFYFSKATGVEGLGVYVNDGTNNRRVALFVDNTNSLWGLSHSSSTGQVPFVIRVAASELLRLTTTGNLSVIGTIASTGNIYSVTTDTHTLGSTTYRWYGVYVGSSITTSGTRALPSTSSIVGEIRAFQSGASDGGLLRMSAGGGTGNYKSYIDLTGYSTDAATSSSIYLGTNNVDRVRINSTGTNIITGVLQIGGVNFSDASRNISVGSYNGTGTLTVSNPSAATYIVLDRVATNNEYILFRTGGVNQWYLGMSPSSENFRLYNPNTSTNAVVFDNTTNGATFISTITSAAITTSGILTVNNNYILLHRTGGDPYFRFMRDGNEYAQISAYTNTATAGYLRFYLAPSAGGALAQTLVVSNIAGVHAASFTGALQGTVITATTNMNAPYYQISATTVIDASRNLINIGTIGSTGNFTITSGNIILTAGQLASALYTTTTTLNWNNSSVQYIVLANGGQTFTFANPLSGGRYILILKQPAAGAAGTITWPATILWQDGIVPTLTTTNDKTDVISFVYDSVNAKYYGSYTYNY